MWNAINLQLHICIDPSIDESTEFLRFGDLFVFAVSGTVPEQPVISKKSGLVFERRLVEKVIEETGRCPVTDEPLEKDDLLEISTSKSIQPRPLPATSIPGLLTLLQNEWDATVLEAHQLRKSLYTSRQELSHALYQHDAACRVIARLLKERDEYRKRLEAIELSVPTTTKAAEGSGKRAPEDGEEGEEAPAGKKPRPALGSDVVEAVTACSTALSKTRKKRHISETVATIQEISGYSLQGCYPIHNTRKGGVNSISIAHNDSDSIVATAGNDGTVQIFDLKMQQSVALLSGHKKKVHDVSFIGNRNLLASGGADGNIRVWKASEGEDDVSYACSLILADQEGEVVAINVHPTNDYVLSASSDGVWCFYDLQRGECLAKVSQETGESEAVDPYSCARLHPDGLILATGGKSSSRIRIWESRTQKCVAKFDDNASCLSFSENGYYMASSGAEGVKVWDLRKLKTIQSLESKYPVEAVAFDYSGLYLGVGSKDAKVYAVKQNWDIVKEFTDVPKKGVYSMAWANDAKSMLVGGSDHNLRLFSSGTME